MVVRHSVLLAIVGLVVALAACAGGTVPSAETEEPGSVAPLSDGLTAHRVEVSGTNGLVTGRASAGVDGWDPDPHAGRDGRRRGRGDPRYAERGRADELRCGRERLRNDLRQGERSRLLAERDRRGTEGAGSQRADGRRVGSRVQVWGDTRIVWRMDRLVGAVRHDASGSGARTGDRIRGARTCARPVRGQLDRVLPGDVRRVRHDRHRLSARWCGAGGGATREVPRPGAHLQEARRGGGTPRRPAADRASRRCARRSTGSTRGTSRGR